MRTVGIDPACPGFSGMALCSNGEILRSKAWRPPKRTKESNPTQFVQMYRWLFWQLHLYKPDIVAVEKLQVFMSKTVVRQLAQAEGIALLAAKQKCPIVVSMNVSSARAIVLNDGSLSKDDAWAKMKKQFPEHDFGFKTKGGEDRMDAATLGLAVEDFLERER